MIDVSIIVIAFDVREEVLECLDSVERHRGAVRVEPILVDNGSTDGTAEAVTAAHPGVRIVRLASNEGLVARNHGLRLARGRLRMFLDSDALLTSGALEELVAFIDRHPAVGLVGPRIEYPDGTMQLSTRRFPPLMLPVLRRPPLDRLFEHGPTVRWHLMADEDHDHAREVEYVIGACQLFTAEAQAVAGEIDPKIFFGPDDADWCLRIRTAGLRIAYDPRATVIHAYRRSSRRPLSRIAVSHLRSYAHFQWKWRNRRRELLEEGRQMDRRAALGGLDSGGGLPAG